MTVRILVGDVRAGLAMLPDASVQTVVTSPPCFGLRSYLPAGHPDKALEMGSEETPEAFIAALVDVFRDVRRVLRADGTAWVNIGDSYAGARGGPQGASGQMVDRSLSAQRVRHRGFTRQASGLKDKDLIGIPWMLAFALRADGWYLRQEIIWHKPSCMPESVDDRPTRAHEQVFLLSKSQTYFYDAEAISEPTVGKTPHDVTGGRYSPPGQAAHTGSRQPAGPTCASRNSRTVWSINGEPFTGAHFATMPSKLATQCILAGTSEVGCCPHCAAPWERMLVKGEPDRAAQRAAGGAADGSYTGQSTKGHAAAGVQNASDIKRRTLEGMVEKITAAWLMTCDCPIARPVPCIVLDPFGGAGTTALAADRLKRDAILTELSAEFAVMAENRLRADGGMWMTVKRETVPTQVETAA